MTEPLAYLNGAYLPLSQVHLNINDAGFIWGATVTDLVRTFRHQLFRLDAHLIRFRKSCELARIPQRLDDDQLAGIAQELVRHNAKLIQPTQDLCLCMFATPGEIGYYVGKPGGPGAGLPTLCMHTFPLPFERYARLIREGAKLLIAQTRQVSSWSITPAIKHRSRLHFWLADQEVHQRDSKAIALLRRSEPGYPFRYMVTETATANFLLVKGYRVLSPPYHAILEGISRSVVEELCGELGLEFEEEDLTDEECKQATEAMLCSTPYCLAPVSHIDDQPIPWPGPVFQQLIAAWNRKVGLDIWGQICSEADRPRTP